MTFLEFVQQKLTEDEIANIVDSESADTERVMDLFVQDWVYAEWAEEIWRLLYACMYRYRYNLGGWVNEVYDVSSHRTWLRMMILSAVEQACFEIQQEK